MIFRPEGEGTGWVNILDIFAKIFHYKPSMGDRYSTVMVMDLPRGEVNESGSTNVYSIVRFRKRMSG
jgi:hypothetical protein